MVILLLIAVGLVSSIAAGREEARVSLVGPLTVLTELNFGNELLKSNHNSFINLDAFPSIIYELGKRASSGTITFTRGVWDDSLWSEPPFSTKTHGFDLELSGVKKYQLNKHVYLTLSRSEFAQVINMISGYFCATVSRVKAEQVFIKNKQIWASIPQEPLCVENLQPFLDLLPNRGVTGLASMIMPEAIHRSEYYAMQIHFTSTDAQLSFQASIFLVNDVNRWDRYGSKSN